MKKKLLAVSLLTIPVLVACGTTSSLASSIESITSSQPASSSIEEKVKASFKNEDESLIQEVEVVKGQAPVYTGETPVKNDDLIIYEFTGWTYNGDLYTTDALPTITEDASFVATFAVAHEAVQIDWNVGGEVNSTYAKWGTEVTAPEDPTKAADDMYTYAFAGWSTAADGEVLSSIPNAVENVTYYAIFEETYIDYTITFVIGSESSTEEYHYNDIPSYKGETPTKAADVYNTYAFAGWAVEGTTDVLEAMPAVKGEATYVAIFTPTAIEYTVNFVDEDGTTVLQSLTLGYGEAIAYTAATPTKASTAEFEYTFDAWLLEGEKVEALGTVTGNVTYVASYTSSTRSYQITFQNDNGDILQQGNVPYGTVPTYTEEEPTKESTAQYIYEFAGWDEEIVAVTGEKVYTATYDSEVQKYQVKFVNDAGESLQSKLVAYGTEITYTGETPTKASTNTTAYTFAGWAKEGETTVLESLGTVTGAVTFHPIWNESEVKYTIKFVAENGDVLGQGSYSYNAVPEFDGEDPTKPNDVSSVYTFTGWKDANGTLYTGALPNVTENVTYTVAFSATPRQYEVKTIIKYVDGTADGSDSVNKPYNATTPVMMTAPTVEGYVANRPTYGVLVKGNVEETVYYSALAAYDGDSASASLAGEGTAESPYLVSSAADLMYIKTQLEGGNYFEGKFLKMTQSIDCGSKDMHFGTQTVGFNGSFDGNNCIIKNYKSAYSLFGFIGAKAVVKNLSVDGEITGTGPAYSAAIVLRATKGSELINLNNYASVKSIKPYSAGVVSVTAANMTGCNNYGKVDNDVVGNTANHTGGVVAATDASITTAYPINIKNCNNYGEVLGNSETGGVFGGNDSKVAVLTMESCDNFGDVYGTYSTTNQLAGGVFGGTNGLGCTNKLIRCNNYGKVSGTNDEGKTIIISKVGGVTGGNLTAAITMYLEECNNYGLVTSERDFGGVIGYLASAGKTQVVKNCKNFGEVKVNSKLASTTVYAGGVIGSIVGSGKTTNVFNVSGCVNEGRVFAYAYSGGVIGSIYGAADALATVNVTDCTNNGTVEGYTDVSGIVGYEFNFKTTGTFTNCVNNGTIHNTTAAATDTLKIAYTGGILGWVRTTDADVMKNCTNNGKVISDKLGGIAGIVAYTGGDTTLTLEGCANNGDITCAGNHVGGILASTTAAETTKLYIRNCSNSGTITGGSYVAGVIAHIDCVSFVEYEFKGLTNTGTIVAKASYGEIIGVSDLTNPVVIGD